MRKFTYNGICFDAFIIDMGIEYRFQIELKNSKLLRLDCPNHLWYWPTDEEQEDMNSQMVGKMF